MKYWVVRTWFGESKRLTGPHYAIASAWDSLDRIEADHQGGGFLDVHDDDGNPQERVKPSRPYAV